MTKNRHRHKKRSSQTDWVVKATVASRNRHRLFQKQVQSLCGSISVNNAIGIKVLERNDVDKFVKRNKRGGDTQGNYSAEPLQLALAEKGYDLVRVKGKGHMWLASQKSGRFIVLGWPSSQNDPMHYIAVDADEQIILDSARKNILKLDSGGILTCLRHGATRIWRIGKRM